MPEELRRGTEAAAAAEKGSAQHPEQPGGAVSDRPSVPRDKVEAAKWLREAADPGHALAQSNLANLYFAGQRRGRGPQQGRRAGRGRSRRGNFFVGRLQAWGLLRIGWAAWPRTRCAAANDAQGGRSRGIVQAQAAERAVTREGRGITENPGRGGGCGCARQDQADGNANAQGSRPGRVLPAAAAPGGKEPLTKAHIKLFRKVADQGGRVADVARRHVYGTATACGRPARAITWVPQGGRARARSGRRKDYKNVHPEETPAKG